MQLAYFHAWRSISTYPYIQTLSPYRCYEARLPDPRFLLHFCVHWCIHNLVSFFVGILPMKLASACTLSHGSIHNSTKRFEFSPITSSQFRIWFLSCLRQAYPDLRTSSMANVLSSLLEWNSLCSRLHIHSCTLRKPTKGGHFDFG